MDRREFMNKFGTVAAAAAAGATTLTDKAEAFEATLIAELDRVASEPAVCAIGAESKAGEFLKDGKHFLMGDDPRLPRMPAAPTLVDFFKYRFAPANHVLQSAALALGEGHNEKVVLACLLHDIAIEGLFRSDHGYWAAQLVEPYVDEEVSWAIRYHQALRFFPDEAVGYAYPEAYIRFFGADYEPDPYIRQAHDYARNHKWYMTSRLITINDVYAFDPAAKPRLDDFVDIIGRNFRQPEEGLGFDNSPVAHMWRTMIWPTKFL